MLETTKNSNGRNIVWVDQQNDLVVVLRWTDKAKIGNLIDHITGALKV